MKEFSGIGSYLKSESAPSYEKFTSIGPNERCKESFSESANFSCTRKVGHTGLHGIHFDFTAYFTAWYTDSGEL